MEAKLTKVELEADGQKVTLCYDMNAVVLLEDKWGVSLTEFDQVLTDKISTRQLRDLLWAGLQRERPDTSEQEAGAMLDLVGFSQIIPLIMGMFKIDVPDMTPQGDGPKEGLSADDPLSSSVVAPRRVRRAAQRKGTRSPALSSASPGRSSAGARP